ncbi:MAG: peptide deformylase [Bacilli bacterium]
MFKKLNILDEKNSLLRLKSKEVTKPLSKHEEDLIKQAIKQLTYSQIEKYEKKYNLRPGTGLAFPQLGISKRIIIIVDEYDKGKFQNYILINPKIISHSLEKIAAEMGEGCLSVSREIDGHVPRYARVTVTGIDIDGNLVKIRAREELAIAFQHEIDHLDGILFFDHINKKKPFFTAGEMRLI